MTLFSSTEAQQVAAAIAAAEKNTSGEIVCVVARAASDYHYVPVIWAALIAMTVPFPLLKWTLWSAEFIYLVQLVSFLALAVVLWLAPFRFAMVPRFLMRRRARIAAREQFLAQSIMQTEWRTGCLIYVAEAERYAEVIADAYIATRVDEAVWRQTIEALTDALKDRRPVDGFVRAIAICGDVLERFAPPRVADKDELPNRLILLD
jgi:putative membrane protein